MIRLIPISLVAGALVALFGYVAMLRGENISLRKDLANERAISASCAERTLTILRKKERDNAIDMLPDGGLADAAREWLRK